ncbi:MAG: DUF2283 domain-containing protein [Phycisphaerales bacterium]|nr:DUF2283 domain-containing protein [Phycisphaerales bacterium]MCI0674510.1 DUF2283 domain-containing protein [Phycisphaerales bacterium]
MKLTYDPKYNVAYIHLREKPAEVETIHLSDELKVDIAPDGTVYGIELLNANEQLGETLIVEGNGAKPTQVELRKVG